MIRLLIVLVAVLLIVDALTLTALSRQRAVPTAPDLTPRVQQLETDLAQAQQDVGELKQQVALLLRRGQPED